MAQTKRKIRKNEKRVLFRSRLEKPARKVPTRIPHSTSKFWEESCQSGKEEAFVEAIEFLSARFSPLTPAKTLKVSPDIFNIVEESIDCAEEELPVTELFHRLMVRSSKYFVTQLKELEPIRPRELMGPPMVPCFEAEHLIMSETLGMLDSLDPMKLVPMKITWKHADLVPELYFYLKSNFGLQSSVHWEFCERTYTGFHGCFKGRSQQEVSDIYHEVDLQFGEAFTTCFDSEFYDLIRMFEPLKHSIEGVYLPVIMLVSNIVFTHYYSEIARKYSRQSYISTYLMPIILAHIFGKEI